MPKACPVTLVKSSENPKNGMSKTIFKIEKGEIPNEFFSYIQALVFDSILLAAEPSLKTILENLNSIKQELKWRLGQKGPDWSDKSKTYHEKYKLQEDWLQRGAGLYALLLGSSHEIYVGMRTKKGDPVHTLFYPTIQDVASKHNLDLISNRPSLLEKIGKVFIEEIRWFRSSQNIAPRNDCQKILECDRDLPNSTNTGELWSLLCLPMGTPASAKSCIFVGSSKKTSKTRFS